MHEVLKLTGEKVICGILANRSGTRALGISPTWLVNTGRWGEDIAGHRNRNSLLVHEVQPERAQYRCAYA